MSPRQPGPSTLVFAGAAGNKSAVGQSGHRGPPGTSCVKWRPPSGPASGLGATIGGGFLWSGNVSASDGTSSIVLKTRSTHRPRRMLPIRPPAHTN